MVDWIGCPGVIIGGRSTRLDELGVYVQYYD